MMNSSAYFQMTIYRYNSLARAGNVVKVLIGFVGYFCMLVSESLYAQDPAVLIDEAKVLERKYKEDEALAMYKQAYSIQPTNIVAAIKSSELCGNMGRRTDGSIRVLAWMNEAMAFADAAIKIDSNSAAARTAKALAFRNLAETEEKKDKSTAYLRQWKQWSENALVADSSFARAKHLLGRWHLEVLTQGGIRKAQGKILYGGIPDANIETAITLMEQCRDAEPYFCANFLDLAKAYNYQHSYEKAIQTLERLAKLPTRRQDDKEIKAEGADLLLKLQ
jgi:tetratricopeptide (TPR) repeat protein